MKLRLNRPTVCEGDAIIGRLCVDDVFECFTLEDTDRRLEDGGDKVCGRTCIPRGTYKVTVDYSNHFGKMLPRILDVPQFDGVRIHPGNKPEDTHGCLLVGTSRSEAKPDWINNSKMAYQMVLTCIENELDRGGTVEIEFK